MKRSRVLIMFKILLGILIACYSSWISFLLFFAIAKSYEYLIGLLFLALFSLPCLIVLNLGGIIFALVSPKNKLQILVGNAVFLTMCLAGFSIFNTYSDFRREQIEKEVRVKIAAVKEIKIRTGKFPYSFEIENIPKDGRFDQNITYTSTSEFGFFYWVYDSAHGYRYDSKKDLFHFED